MTDSKDKTYSAVVGKPPNEWHIAAADGDRVFNLSREKSQSGLKVKVSTGAHVLVNPARSALVIIDMQNYFLSSALGRERGAGHEACDKLAQYAIPAARKAGMQILWVNWGLTEQDMETMPAAVTRCFGIDAVVSPGSGKVVLDRHANLRTDRTYAGLGSGMGKLLVPESEIGASGASEEVDAGRLLFRDTWNADIYGPFSPCYEPSKGDKWIHKNRMSGLWGDHTPLQVYLKANGITTLFFAGVNTDQCVGGTLTDAFSRGYDCILLSDGCGTTSPPFAQQAWEFNCENTFGFVTTCSDLWDAAWASSDR